jgi:hypothetical protein
MANSSQFIVTYNGTPVPTAKSFEATPEGGGAEAKRGMTPNGKVLGYRALGQPSYTITLTVDYEPGIFPDWRALENRFDQEFTLGHMEKRTGAHVNNYMKCIVTSVADSSDENGNTEMSVTIMSQYREVVK